MNEYQRVKIMQDRRWTNSLKCDIIQNITRLGEAEKCTRFRGMDIIMKNEKKYHAKLKRDIKKYHSETKDMNAGYMNKILTGVEDSIRKVRYGRLHPKDVKLSIWNSLNRIHNESNMLKRQINETVIIINNARDRFSKLKFNDKHATDKKTNVIMGKISNVEKKTTLVHFNNRKISEMVDYARQNLVMYDSLIEQVQSEVSKMSTNIMKIIEIGTMFKEDANSYAQNYINEKLSYENFINRGMFRLNYLNSIMDRLEHNR